MKNYVVYFKEVPAPLPLACEGFEVVTKYSELEREMHSWIRVYGDRPGLDVTKAGVFLQHSAVAAIIPAEYDPAAPGFLVYLRGQPAPLIVKADALGAASYAASPRFFHIIGGHANRGSGPERFRYRLADDIYVAASEVLAVLPEDVTEGEAEDGESDDIA